VAVLSYVALVTAQRFQIARGQLDDAAVAQARSAIDRALEHGAAVLPDPLGRFAITVERFGAAAQVTVAAQGKGEHDLLSTFGVAPRARAGAILWWKLAGLHAELYPAFPAPEAPPAPWCGVVVLPGMARHEAASQWLPDFEATVAWAWLERDDG
jgi:hypothetical protein